MAHHTSSDPNVFILPDLGEGVHEAELIAWKVAPGDRVEEHQTLAEMETDKALVEVPSPRAGVIAQLHGEPGQILKVGQPLVTYAASDDAAAAQPAQAKQAEASSTPSQANGAAPPPAQREPAQREEEDAGTVVGSLSASPALSAGRGKALATPAVRRLARDLGVDINAIRGTGIGGRVTERDVRAAAGQQEAAAATTAGGRLASLPTPSPTPPAQAPPAQKTAAASPAAEAPSAAPAATPTVSAGQKRIPFIGTRRKIAERMRRSVDHAVHFLIMEEADVSGLDAARRRLAAASGEKLSLLPFVLSAVCRALRDQPELNATVDDERSEIVQHSDVHLGVATDTEHGLNVPVVRGADQLGLLQLSRAVADLAQRARQRTISREELTGSTFTVSNLGTHFGRFYGPIINYPEVALLAVGRARDAVVARDGAIAVVKALPLTVVCDHRVVDGAEGARFLQRVIELLEGDPDELLAPARSA